MTDIASLPRSTVNKWLDPDIAAYGYSAHPSKPGHLLITANRGYPIHGIYSILELLKHGSLLGKSWTKSVEFKAEEDRISISMPSDNPLAIIAEGLQTYRRNYPTSEEIFNIGASECLSLVVENIDYKALATIPIGDDLLLSNFPCTVHLVELTPDKRFVPVTMSSMEYLPGKFSIDIDKYFILCNPLGLDNLDIDAMMIALSIKEANYRIGRKELQIVKDAIREYNHETYEELLKPQYMRNTLNH